MRISSYTLHTLIIYLLSLAVQHRQRQCTVMTYPFFWYHSHIFNLCDVCFRTLIIIKIPQLPQANPLLKNVLLVVSWYQSIFYPNTHPNTFTYTGWSRSMVIFFCQVSSSLKSLGRDVSFLAGTDKGRESLRLMHGVMSFLPISDSFQQFHLCIEPWIME